MALNLTVRDVEAGYGAVRALHGVSIEIRDGETVVLLGTNGNGKSTLMKCIMGLVRPSAGSIVADEAMAGLSSGEVDDILTILYRLNEQGITIIMIEHIMQAVMRFSQRVVCLDAGRIICEGSPEEIVRNPGVQRAYLGA